MTSTIVENYPLNVAHDLPVIMKDGTVLRADVFRPAIPGRYPVLICRTPYNKSRERYRQSGNLLASRGYLVVIQDTRGRYKSDGEFIWMFGDSSKTFEENDGYDTIAWAASLKGSDGRVGTFGNSYDGYTSWMSAAGKPPDLKGVYASGKSAISLDTGIESESPIRLLPTAVVFAKGHRIRLDISSSDFPNFDRNHNTGRNFWEDPELMAVVQTVFHETEAPSHVMLPVVEI